MRVLILSAAYSGDSGGVATHVVNLASALVRLPDTAVHVVARRKAGQDFKKDSKGNLTEWKFKRRQEPEFSGRRVILEHVFETLAVHWHQILPDVIHAHDWDSAVLGLMLRTAFRVPLVMTVHRAPTPWRDTRIRANAKDAFMEAFRLHDMVDQLVVPSRASAGVLDAQGFRHIEVIPHGLTKHLTSFTSDPSLLRSLGWDVDTRLVFCPVRADEHKSPETFVRAAAKLKKELPAEPLLFVVTSDAEDDAPAEDRVGQEELRAIAAANQLAEGKDIKFVKPFSYGTELATIYAAAEVVVVPSREESFGQTVLDAHMFRKPVIARQSMALIELVKDDVSGLLFSKENELVQQMHRLLIDKDLGQRLAKNGYERLDSHYDPDHMAARYRALFETVIARWRL